jgi:hypothetical protein
VADHSWRMALLSLLFADTPDVDHVRCMKIGLVVACIASPPLPPARMDTCVDACMCHADVCAPMHTCIHARKRHAYILCMYMHLYAS